jgi:hypothetical protein
MPMTIRPAVALAVALSLTLLASSLAAQESPPWEVEIGIRTLDVSGNEEMYRTQINERSGVLLRSFTLLTTDIGGPSSRYLDRLRIDASELGAGPAGSLRIEAGKADLYTFRLGYRHSNEFSAFPGQHTYARTRNSVDADLDLLPGRSLTPFAGFSLYRSNGPGTTSYTLGGDEFRLSQDLTDRERELRVGTGFNFGSLSGSVTQGWRRARSTEQLSLSPAEGGGNSADPLLGHPVFAGVVNREDSTRVDTPFTNLFVTGLAGPRLRITGDYVRFVADSTGDLTESASGSFVSFAISRFFNGLSTLATSSAKNTTWRGGARAEYTAGHGVTAFAGYRREHRDLSGSALIDTIYIQTLTFGGIDPRDLEAVLQAKSSIERNETVTNAGVAARALGPFAVRLEVREAKQELTVAPDLSEIVVPGGQGGDFERRITTLDGSASYTASLLGAAFTIGAAVRHDSANEPVFRTDFRQRDRVRIRAGWAAPKWIRAGLTAEETRQRNDQPGIALDGKTRQYSGDVEVTPQEAIVFRASLSRFRADTSILTRAPQNFTTAPSLYAENGRSAEGGVAVNFAPLTFELSVARFRNRGANPFEIQRARARIGFDLPAKTKTGLIAEYSTDEYSEESVPLAGFNARRFGLFVRYRP